MANNSKSIRNFLYIPFFVLLFSATFVPAALSQNIFGTKPDTENILEITPDTGEGTILGSPGFVSVRALACDNITNTLYGVDANSGQLLIINQFTGQASVVGLVGFENVASLAFDPNTNTLYGVDGILDELITINTSTGEGTSVGFNVFRNILGLAFDSSTNTLYGVNPDQNNNYLVTINTNTGVASMVGDIAGFEIIVALTYDRSTDTLYAADETTGEFINVNRATAAGTVIGNIGLDDVNGLGVCGDRSVDVPTLSEWGLIAMAVFLGVVALVIVRRKNVFE